MSRTRSILAFRNARAEAARRALASSCARATPTSPALPTVLALGLCFAGCAPFVYQAEFARHSDTVLKGDLLGPYTGRVLDSGSGKPISGALVYASWELVRGVGFVVPGGAKVYVTRTNTDGRYQIPPPDSLPGGATRAVASFRLVVYKRGYVAYRSDRIFPGDERRFDFVQLGNRVGLERWNPDLSHVDHLRFVGGGGALRRACAWEVHAAVAQIEGRPMSPLSSSSGSTGGDANESGDLLDISALLDEDDIEEITGYDGGFTVGRLADIPRSARYDSRHFRATGKSQAFDAAYRVWRLGAKGAEHHYSKLLKAYPNAQPKDELGDRSFRSRNKKIGALVWFVKKRGVVVALTCGWSLCKTPAKLLSLARALHDRLDQLDESSKPLPGLEPRPVNPFQPVRPRNPVLR